MTIRCASRQGFDRSSGEEATIVSSPLNGSRDGGVESASEDILRAPGPTKTIPPRGAEVAAAGHTCGHDSGVQSLPLRAPEEKGPPILPVTPFMVLTHSSLIPNWENLFRRADRRGVAVFSKPQKGKFTWHAIAADSL